MHESLEEMRLRRAAEEETIESPLEVAARSGSVEELQQEFATIRSREPNEIDAHAIETALHVATEENHWDAVRYLYGTTGINITEKHAAFLLQHATVAGDTEMAKFALDRGAIAASASGGRALLCAAATANAELLELLEGRGANFANAGGEAALAAARKGHWEVATGLVARGAGLECGCGLQLLAMAEVGGVVALREALASRGVLAEAANTEAGAEALQGLTSEWPEASECVMYLMANGVDVSSSAAAETLILAAMYGDAVVVRALLERGMDATADAGSRALASAGLLGPCGSDQLVTECLLGHGAIAVAPQALELDEDF